MGRMWTDEQLLAIDHRDGNMLVSAAAGSGKTAVLVERVMRLITDRDDPVDIDQFLIITYTKAAASELRGKIIDEISSRLSVDPNNARLYRQLALAYSAKISTVHAYCLELIRANAHRIGIPLEFRIADSTERSVIFEQCLEETVEKAYEDADFDQLAELFYGERNDDQLLKAVSELYESYRSHPYPDQWADEMIRCAETDETDIVKTIWGKYLMNRAKTIVTGARECIENTIDEIENDYPEFSPYLKALGDDLDASKRLENAFAGGWDAVREELFGINFTALARIRNVDEKLRDRIKAKRDTWKCCVKKLKEKIFTRSNDECIGDIHATAPLVRVLFETVRQFDAVFSEEKLRQALADFGDLEHMAIRLLVTGEDHEELTDVAYAEQAKFRYVFVDEYQDSNRVQETIFRAVSRGNNLFMVGDIKQSIYSFRLADPTLFGEKLRCFKPAASAKKGEPALFELSRNFRSRPQVLDAANAYMRALMSEQAGGVDYVGGQVLQCGAPQNFPKSDENYLAEINLIEMKTDGSETDEDGLNSVEAEAEFAAARIEKLIADGFLVTDKDGVRPARYSDIVIFLRSTKNAPVYADALAGREIPCRMDKQGAFFESTEISATVSVLAAISNITRDVSLIAALRSPIFGFTADELAEIRLCGKGTFYSALRKAVIGGNRKADEFLKVIAKWRKMAANTGVDRLIWSIYSETGALGIFSAMENGKARRDNLQKLYEVAKRFEHAGFKGLDNFLKYIERAGESEKNGEESIAPARETATNAVRIMSIHKSKGLEFPIVLFCNMNHQFNLSDLRKDVLISEQFGVGVKCRHSTKNIAWSTIVQNTASDANARKIMSEELRVLYVALTRPKDKLIIVGHLSQTEECFHKAAAAIKNGKISPENVLEGNSWINWMLWPLLLDRFMQNGKCVINSIPKDGWMTELFDVHRINVDEITTAKMVGKSNDRPLDTDLVERYYQGAKQAISVQYPHSSATETPSKLTATGIARTFYESEAAENADVLISQKRTRIKAKNDGLTAAEQGNAVHTAMQQLDFSECVNAEGVQRELERLVDNGILSQQEREAVDTSMIVNFVNDPETNKFIEGAVHREYKFSVLLPAEDYYGEKLRDEKILLQGVVDLWNETDEIRLLDFKTDRVRAGEEEESAKKYHAQIRAYRSAIEAVTGKTVKESAVYFLRTGKYIYVN